MVYQKFVSLQFPFYKFELSVGAILYPLTFLVTDLIVESYGKEKAQFCVKLAVFYQYIGCYNNNFYGLFTSDNMVKNK